MLLHAHRLREGQPLYAPPSLSFVAFAYPPLQPALVAGASVLFGLDYVTGARDLDRRVTSSPLVAAYAFLREAGMPRALALGGLAVSAAAFAPTGAWYDLVRIDSVWLGLVTAGPVGDLARPRFDGRGRDRRRAARGLAAAPSRRRRRSSESPSWRCSWPTRGGA